MLENGWPRYKDAIELLKQYCWYCTKDIQYIPRNMHTVFALLCFVVVIHWLIFPYPSGLLHWHCGNLTIAPVPAKQSWWIWINISCGFIMSDCITTTKQSTTKPCAYFIGYTAPSVNLHPSEIFAPAKGSKIPNTEIFVKLLSFVTQVTYQSIFKSWGYVTGFKWSSIENDIYTFALSRDKLDNTHF